MLVHAVGVTGDNARAFLPPVLLRIKGKIGQARCLVMIINAENATFVLDHTLLLLHFPAQVHNPVVNDRGVGIRVPRKFKLFQGFSGFAQLFQSVR